MLRRILVLAAVLAVPGVLVAQGVPNSHASDTAKSKVASKVAQNRATKVRGTASGTDNRPVRPATRAVPATPSSGGSAGVPASPAVPAMPAVPASPSQRPSSPGSQAGGRRP